MTPIKLKIQGLNSFIEEQVIDFEKLTKHGLFGVFGDTGSGKSTILDAMTLALYGEVSRKTKHYINSKSNSAIINFEFSVIDKVTKNRVVYKVERTFVKSKKNNANNKHAKISDITDPDNIIVLESKAKEVNQRCYKIINLSLEDFFRIVTIPQGEFSKFLELQNKPRRDVLEKLFNLQEFGDDFESKIKNRKEKVAIKVEVINKTLEGIKILNPEEFNQLKSYLDEIENKIDAKKKEYDLICEEYNSVEANCNLQKDETKIKEEMQTIESQRSQIDSIREQIKVSEKAKTVKTFIDNKNNLQSHYISATQKLSQITQILDEFEVDKVKIYDGFEKAEADKYNKTKKLIDRKSKLEHALKDETTLNELISSISKIQDDINNSNLKKDTYKVALGKIETKQSQLIDLQSNLQTQITQNTISTKLKANVVKGTTLLNELKNLKKMLEKQVEEKANVNNSIDELQKELKGFDDNKTKLNTEIGSLSVSKTYEIDAKKLGELKEQLKSNRDLSQKNEINKSILALKDACHIGEPCPVCGKDLDCLPAFCEDDGNDYRKIISGIEDEIKTLEDDMKSKEIAQINEKGKLEADLAAVKANITNTKNLIDTQTKKTSKLAEEIDELETEIKDKTILIDDIKTSTKIEDFAAMEKEISAKEESKELLEPQIIKARDELEELNKQIKDVTDKSSKIDSDVSGFTGQLETNLDTKNSITKKLKEQFGENFDITGDLNGVNTEITTIEVNYTKAKAIKDDFETKLKAKEDEKTAAQSKADTLKKQKETADKDLADKLQENGFDDDEQVENSLMTENIFAETKKQVENFDAKSSELIGALKQTQEKLNGVYKTEGDLTNIKNTKDENETILDEMKETKSNKANEYDYAQLNLSKFNEQSIELEKLNNNLALLDQLLKSVGSKRLVEYISIERLKRICFAASDYLLEMTDGKYELRIDSEGNFITKRGAYERPVSTLSGGEKFTTSLALALALSTEIQKKAGTKMELFFLDEGFGSLDEKLAEIVMDTIAKIPNQNMKVGIISHIESIKDRVPVKLLVEAATNISGSTISIA